VNLFFGNEPQVNSERKKNSLNLQIRVRNIGQNLRALGAIIAQVNFCLQVFLREPVAVLANKNFVPVGVLHQNFFANKRSVAREDCALVHVRKKFQAAASSLHDRPGHEAFLRLPVALRKTFVVRLERGRGVVENSVHDFAREPHLQRIVTLLQVRSPEFLEQKLRVLERTSVDLNHRVERALIQRSLNKDPHRPSRRQRVNVEKNVRGSAVFEPGHPLIWQNFGNGCLAPARRNTTLVADF
jgi:hypothetical protein